MDAGETLADGEVRSGFVSGNTFGYRPVQYHVVDGLAMFEGDIVLGTVEEMERTAAAVANLPADGAAAAVIITGNRFRWPGGVVPFTIDPRLPDVARVEQAIAHWHSRTPIRIVPRTDQENFVTFRPGSGCSSPAGMRGWQQFITLADGCGRGQVIHEIGHAVGLWHEQSREDRDQFIRVLEQNIEPGEEDNFRQHITDGDDVGPYDFGSIMHYGTHFFSRNGQPTIMTLHGEAIGQRNALSAGDIQAVNAMYFPSISLPLTLGAGVYTIQQQSNGRFVDAHEIGGKDFAIVTRPAQNNDTQRWRLRPQGGVYTIQQQSNGRFVDAHEIGGKDFAIVTRPPQNNDTQRWVYTLVGDDTYTVRQRSNGRFMDAYENPGKDFALVTRQAKNSDAQRWVTTPLGPNTFTIRQKSSGRFMDAHEIAEKDFALVTRPAQNNSTQRWMLTPIGVVCTLQQESSGRFVDAYENAPKDFALVTRSAKGTDAQRWIVLAAGGGAFTIQQQSSGRFMDAHEIAEKDFALVTRPPQNNSTQRWMIKRV